MSRRRVAIAGATPAGAFPDGLRVSSAPHWGVDGIDRPKVVVVVPIPSKKIRFGAIEVHLDAQRTYVGGREVESTALEFRLLTTLMERRGRVRSREVLLRDVWRLASDLATRTVDTHVHRLRAKLGVAAASVQTVRGVGYRFVVPDAPEHANLTS